MPRLMAFDFSAVLNRPVHGPPGTDVYHRIARCDHPDSQPRDKWGPTVIAFLLHLEPPWLGLSAGTARETLARLLGKNRLQKRASRNRHVPKIFFTGPPFSAALIWRM